MKLIQQSPHRRRDWTEDSQELPRVRPAPNAPGFVSVVLGLLGAITVALWALKKLGAI